MARIADNDRPALDWDAVETAIDRPVSETRTSGKTVEDIPQQIRNHVEHALANSVVRVIPINPAHGNAAGMAKEIVRLAKLFGELREPKLTIGATVVENYHVPGHAKPIPLAVTIYARPKINRPRKAPGKDGMAPAVVPTVSANGTGKATKK